MALLLLIQAASLTAQPRLILRPGKNIDLGDLYTGQQVVKSVVMVNAGTDTLRLTSIEPSCGCTAVMLEKSDSTIAPSDSQHLIIAYSVENKSGPEAKSVTIASNDTLQPQVTVVLSAFLIPRLEVLPPFVVLTDPGVDSAYHETLHLRNQGKDRTLRILSVNSGIAGMECSVSKDSLAPSESCELKIDFRPEEKIRGNAQIEITTDQPIDPVFRIPVRIYQ